MPLNAAHATAYISQLDLSAPSRIVAVFGGANGIGEGAVRRLGSLGCRVVILGRDQVNAGKIRDDVKDMKPRGDVAEISFIKCDLSTEAGMKDAVVKLEEQVGPNGLDSAMLFQNGMPTGYMNLTSDGHEQGYAVQSLSRFVVTHHLITSNLLKDHGTVVFVANSGQTLQDLSVEDLSLKQRYAAGRGKIGFFMDQSLRDSSVLDSITIEFNKRYPKYQFHNMSPGLVKTPTFAYDKVPFPFNWLMWAAMFVVGSTPEIFAPVPIYVALCDSDEKSQMIGSTRTWKYNLGTAKPGAWASDAGNRARLWDKLCQSLEHRTA